MFGLIAGSMKPQNEDLSWQRPSRRWKTIQCLTHVKGRYHLYFLVTEGWCCYLTGGATSLFLSRKITHKHSACAHADLWVIGEQQLLCNLQGHIWPEFDAYFENIGVYTHRQCVSGVILVLKPAAFGQTTPIQAHLVSLHGTDKNLVLKRSTGLRKHLCRIQGGFPWYLIHRFQIWPSFRGAGVAGWTQKAAWSRSEAKDWHTMKQKCQILKEHRLNLLT